MKFYPSRESFDQFAQVHNVVPVWCEVLADSDTPLTIFRKLADGPNAFLLESAERGKRWSRYSFIGVDAFSVLRAKGSSHSFEGETIQWAHGESPIALAESAIAGFSSPVIDGLPPLHGGAVGYFAYDCVRFIERLPDDNPDDLGAPDVCLQFTRTLVAFDHFRGVISIICNARPDRGDDYESATGVCAELVAKLSTPLETRPIAPPEILRQVPPKTNTTLEKFTDMIERAREYIAAGDIFQVVLSQRFELETGGADPVDIYRMLRLLNPSPYMYLVRCGDETVVGSSPEALVKIDGNNVITHPIAGTRWRGLTDEKDAALERELRSDPKERAEHLMLVDLARNDIGRVCDYDSVEVTRLMEVDRYSHLMHLVSEVRGTVREGVGPFDVLRATFPAGTVSGAPKVRAMEIIDELESSRRGLYGGVVGYIDFSGNLDTAIALRTTYIKGRVAYVQAGGGIVADAIATDEYQESINKASAVINAIRAAQELL